MTRLFAAAVLGLVFCAGCTKDEEIEQSEERAPLMLAGVTDYATATEVAAVDASTGAVLAKHAVPDGDAVPLVTGGVALILERFGSKIDVLADDGSIVKTIDLSGDGATPPALTHAVAASEKKLYAELHARNRLDVIDLELGAKTGELDLSALHEPSDNDGSLDVFRGVYVPSQQRAYFLAQRIDITTIVAPNYRLNCSPVKALLIGVDTRSDALVDLNGSADGVALELQVASPADIDLDAAGKRLLIVGSGCFEGDARVQSGVEAVALDGLVSTKLYTPDNSDYHGSLIVLDQNLALLETADANFTTRYSPLDLTAGTVGEAYEDVPNAPQYDGAGGLLGVRWTDGTAALVRYDMLAATSTVLASPGFDATLTNTAGTALRR